MNLNITNDTTFHPDGKITLDLPAIIARCMEYDCPKEVTDAMSTLPDVITQVGNQIVDGLTELGSSAGRTVTAHANPNCPLDKAVRAVSLAIDNIQAKEIKRLQDALAQTENEVNRLYAELVEKRYARL